MLLAKCACLMSVPTWDKKDLTKCSEYGTNSLTAAQCKKAVTEGFVGIPHSKLTPYQDDLLNIYKIISSFFGLSWNKKHLMCRLCFVIASLSRLGFHSCLFHGKPQRKSLVLSSMQQMNLTGKTNKNCHRDEKRFYEAFQFVKNAANKHECVVAPLTVISDWW